LLGRFTATLTGTTRRETFNVAVLRNASMSSKTLSGGGGSTSLMCSDLFALQLLEREAERVAPAGDGPSRNLFVDGALPSGVKSSTRTAAAEVCG
jgi:hypothetical protein